MAQLLTSDDKSRDFAYDDGYRAYLITRRDAPGDYRFGRTLGKRLGVRARFALRRVNGFVKNMIEAIANSKLRRMERELELRGIRFDRATNDWVRKYHPEQHYMRGPGPKWREKHFLDRASAGGS